MIRPLVFVVALAAIAATCGAQYLDVVTWDQYVYVNNPTESFTARLAADGMPRAWNWPKTAAVTVFALGKYQNNYWPKIYFPNNPVMLGRTQWLGILPWTIVFVNAASKVVYLGTSGKIQSMLVDCHIGYLPPSLIGIRLYFQMAVYDDTGFVWLTSLPVQDTVTWKK